MIVKTFNRSVDDFIGKLSIQSGTKVTRMIELLQQFGHSLGMPYSRSLGDKLFELRIRGQQEIRILYTFHNDQAILLHFFIKKTQKTPVKEIQVAKNRMKTLTKA